MCVSVSVCVKVCTCVRRCVDVCECVNVCMNVYVSVCLDLFADLGVWGCAWEIGRLGRCVCVWTSDAKLLGGLIRSCPAGCKPLQWVAWLLEELYLMPQLHSLLKHLPATASVPSSTARGSKVSGIQVSAAGITA